MSWSAVLFPSTEPISSVSETEFSPAGSGSLSSCLQVRMARMSCYWCMINVDIVECESLIRKILVLDPSRRISLQQVKSHPWMQAEVGSY